MKKLFALIVLFTLAGVCAVAQNITLSGKVIDGENKEGMESATVQLLSLPDSTYVNGITTNSTGNYTISGLKAGRYALKFTCIGYRTNTMAVTLKAEETTHRVANVTLRSDAIALKEAVVKAEVPPVTVRADTMVYNASAFHTPEGSVLEELVKKLPGAEVDESGSITINGKAVKKILVDGKEFFSGDSKVAMKNLPTNMIENLKAYDKQSDLARLTGIDDGEEETVLDLTVKKNMNKGYFGNIDLGLGTKSRYSDNFIINRFSDNQHMTLTGSANNVNDMGFPGGGGGGRGFGFGRNGLNASKMLGFDFANDNGKRQGDAGYLEFGGNVRFNHTDGDTQSESAAANYISTRTSYTNSKNDQRSRSNSFNAEFRFEWQLTDKTNLIFRPNMSITMSDNWSRNSSVTFNDDPYKYSVNPLLNLDTDFHRSDSVVVNYNNSTSLGHSRGTSLNGQLQLSHNFNKSGRNITLRATYGLNDQNSEQLSYNGVQYWLYNDSSTVKQRFSTTPTKTWNYSAQFTYSEPIAKRTYLQFSYRYQYRYNKSERSTYSLEEFGLGTFATDHYHYNQFGLYLPSGYTSARDEDLSRFSEYHNYINELRLTLRVIRDKYRLNVGLMAMPQKSKFVQRYMGRDIDTVRSVFNITPTMHFRYQFSKISTLQITYRGQTSQPSMEDLLDITDNSNPLNIRRGNPGLKPSFRNTFNLEFNDYNQDHQRGLMARINFQNENNSVSQMVKYNEVTGGRETRPENINGNWSTNGFFMFNTALKDKRFTITSFSNVGYTNSVGFYWKQEELKSVKNSSKSTRLSERLSGTFRNDWLEVGINGSINYNSARNKLQTNGNLDTYTFSYGGNLNIQAPWGTTLASDISENSRRGYSDASMNTNELIWNLQISQSFLKGRAATISLQFYDLLREQSTVSRQLSALSRSDTRYNSITSYAMVHFIYRLNIFGSREARRGMGRGFGGFGGGFGGGRGGRPGGGGFGGPR